jgi:hypothetical protein
MESRDHWSRYVAKRKKPRPAVAVYGEKHFTVKTAVHRDHWSRLYMT